MMAAEAVFGHQRRWVARADARKRCTVTARCWTRPRLTCSSPGPSLLIPRRLPDGWAPLFCRACPGPPRFAVLRLLINGLSGGVVLVGDGFQTTDEASGLVS